MHFKRCQRRCRERQRQRLRQRQGRRRHWQRLPGCCCWSKRLPTFHLRQIWLASQSFLFTYYLQTLLRLQTKSQASQYPPPTAPAHNSHGYPCGPMANYKLFTSVYEFAICSAHFCQPWSPENALTFSCINRALNRARASTLWANFSTLLFALTLSSIQGHARWWKVDRDMATNRRKR